MTDRAPAASGVDLVVTSHLMQAELAQRWRISPRTLERWRCAGTGPAWLQLNGRVLYRLEDVLAYGRAHRQEIVAALARARAAGERPAIVSALEDPMIMPSIDHLPFTFDGVDASLTVEQRFPFSRVRGNRRRAAGRRAHFTLRTVAATPSGEAAPSPEASALDAEQREALLAAVNGLREEDRLVIGCRYFLELSEEETAAALGWRRGTVKSRLSRALARLRERMGEGAYA